MCSNSCLLVKRYSRPSSSDPRGARVVYEMEKSSPSTSVRSWLTSVDFPEPEGAEIIKSMPAIRPRTRCSRGRCLLQILNLLPSLLDLRLHLESKLGNAQAVHAGGAARLRQHRIRLAVQLLQQKIQPLAQFAAGVEQRQEMIDMRPQADDLFLYIALFGQHRSLRQQPLVAYRSALHQL